MRIPIPSQAIRLCTALTLLAACGGDESVSSPRLGGDDAALPTERPGELEPADEDAQDAASCDELDCGDSGFCVLESDGPHCFCSAGTAGTQCEQCAAGFVAVSGPERCVAQLSHSRVETAGANCPLGGVALESGADLDGNGVLSAAEVTTTHYECHVTTCVGERCACQADTCNERGACTLTDRGAYCLCDGGYAGTSCDLCADGFVLAHDGRGCIRPRTLTREVPEPRGVRCAAGGVANLRGPDLDDDGALSADEVRDVSYVCHTPVVRAGSIEVYTQAQLDALVGVTEISGDLTIQTSYVENLAPLARLSRVGGSLRIRENGSLGSLAGLGSLSEVGGSVIVQNNPALRVASFPTLERVLYGVELSANALETLDLGALQSVGSLLVADMPSLTAIDGDALLSVQGDLTLRNLPALGHIEGFATLDAVGGELRLEYLGALDLAPLGNVTELGGLLLSASQVTDAGKLTSLREIRGSLRVFDNPALTTIGTFPALRSVSGGVLLVDNPALTKVEAFAHLDRLGPIMIAGSPLLTEIGAFEPAQWSTGQVCDVFWQRCSSGLVLIDLPALTRFGGMLGSPRIESLRLIGLPQLTSMPGLGELAYLSDVRLVDTGLSELPFTQIHSVSSVEIAENPRLRALTVLEQVSYLNSLTIRGNDTLADVGDWASLSTLGELTIRDNPVLTRLPAAPLLQQVGSLVLVDNPGLVTDGLTHLTRIDGQTTYEPPAAYGAPQIQASVVLGGLPRTLLDAFLSRLTRVWSLVLIDTSLAQAPTLDLTQLSMFGSTELRELTSIPAGLQQLRLYDSPRLERVAIPATMGSTWDFSVTLRDAPLLTEINLPDRQVNGLVLERLPLLEGLSQLSLGSVSQLVVADNPALLSLTGLAAALAPYSTLTVRNNAQLLDVDLRGLTELNTLTIERNAVLPSLSGLETLQWLGALNVRENPVLASAEGVATRVASAYITDNPTFPTCLAEAIAQGAPGEIRGNDDTASCEP